jgi:glycosyltransferase involved in cell wall biosynthesis
MRISHCYKVFFPEVDGGIPEVIHSLAVAHADRAKINILVSRPFGGGSHEATPSYDLRKIMSFGEIMSLPMSPTYPFEMQSRIRASDLVVLHAPFPLGDVGLLLAGRAAPPFVVHWHADIDQRFRIEPIVRPLVRETLSRARAIIVSHEQLLEASTVLQPFRGKVHVVPFGIDAAHWSHLTRQEIDRIASIRASHPRMLLAIGRLVSYKGFDVLIRAMKEVDGTLVIVGAGKLRQRLERQASDLSIGERVTFSGYLPEPEVKLYLHASRALVMPSVNNSETFGLVQLEAMATGRPVINTWLATGVPFVARDNLEGLTVPVGDSASLARAIGRVLDEPGLAERFGQAGAKRAETMFSLRQFTDRCWDIYMSAMMTPEL